MQGKKSISCFIIGAVVFISILGLMHIAYSEDIAGREAFTNNSTWARIHKTRRTVAKRMGSFKDSVKNSVTNVFNKIRGIIY